MIISNNSGYNITYNVTDRSGKYTDSGVLTTNTYVEFQPRGQAPFTVNQTSITLQSVPSPAIVTFWSNGGGFSQ